MTNFVGTLLWFIIYAFCVAPVVLGGWYYYKFLTNPGQTTKAPLPKAHLFNIISIALQFAVFTIFGYAVSTGPLPIGGIVTSNSSGGSIWLSNILVLVFEVLLNYYWMGVVKRISYV